MGIPYAYSVRIKLTAKIFLVWECMSMVSMMSDQFLDKVFLSFPKALSRFSWGFDNTVQIYVKSLGT